MRVTRLEVEGLAKRLGLLTGCWSPGDGKTRYRFFRSYGAPGSRGDYFSDNPVYTALGAQEAWIWLHGYRAGLFTPVATEVKGESK